MLACLIRGQFEHAARSLPCKGEGRYLAEARARNRLEAGLRKIYLSLRPVAQSQDDLEQEDADVDIGQEQA